VSPVGLGAVSFTCHGDFTLNTHWKCSKEAFERAAKGTKGGRLVKSWPQAGTPLTLKAVAVNVESVRLDQQNWGGGYLTNSFEDNGVANWNRRNDSDEGKENGREGLHV
jgi:hypothetical protein